MPRAPVAADRLPSQRAPHGQRQENAAAAALQQRIDELESELKKAQSNRLDPAWPCRGTGARDVYSTRSRGRCHGPHPGPRGSMVKVVPSGSKDMVGCVGIVHVTVGLMSACRAPVRELDLTNTHF